MNYRLIIEEKNLIGGSNTFVSGGLMAHAGVLLFSDEIFHLHQALILG